MGKCSFKTIKYIIISILSQVHNIFYYFYKKNIYMLIFLKKKTILSPQYSIKLPSREMCTSDLKYRNLARWSTRVHFSSQRTKKDSIKSILGQKLHEGKILNFKIDMSR